MMTSLDDVGFATISEKRASSTSLHAPLARCHLVVTDRCNLRCVYCNRHDGDHMPTDLALAVIASWARDGLRTVMISGGEPTLHPDLEKIVASCAAHDLATIILATNGTARLQTYEHLMRLGVTEFSVSLDSGDRARAATIHGTRVDVWDRVVATISGLCSAGARVVVGLIVNPYNEHTIVRDLTFIDTLGPVDIKVTPSSHHHHPHQLADIARRIPDALLERHPFLGYRMRRVRQGLPLKGLGATDSHHCWLCLDDMAVARGHHYPCYIYQREAGDPIGPVAQEMQVVRRERLDWIMATDTHRDPICSRHCVDFYIDYNNRVARRLADEGGSRGTRCADPGHKSETARSVPGR